MTETIASGGTPPFLTLPVNRRIAVCGPAELPAYLDGAASHVISLIDPRLRFEQRTDVGHLLLRLHDIDQVLPGHDAPTRADAETVVSFVSGLADIPGGFSLVIHCHAGISRSSAVALAAMLVLHDRLDPAEALTLLAQHRPQLWPNALFTGHFDRVLGLDGRLVDAVMAYRREAFSQEISARDGVPFLPDR